MAASVTIVSAHIKIMAVNIPVSYGCILVTIAAASHVTAMVKV